MENRKSAAIRLVHEDWLAFKEAVEQAPGDRLETPGVSGDWSIRDLIGHITTWEEVGIMRARDVSQGIEHVKPYDNVDEFNAEEAKRKSQLSVGGLWTQFNQVHEQYMDLLEGIPEECFGEDYRYGPAMSPITPKHKKEHAEEIKRWLDSA